LVYGRSSMSASGYYFCYRLCVGSHAGFTATGVAKTAHGRITGNLNGGEAGFSVWFSSAIFSPFIQNVTVEVNIWVRTD
jgi:hypothetical protein